MIATCGVPGCNAFYVYTDQFTYKISDAERPGQHSSHSSSRQILQKQAAGQDCMHSFYKAAGYIAYIMLRRDYSYREERRNVEGGRGTPLWRRPATAIHQELTPTI